jgi:hypothetical protein
MENPLVLSGIYFFNEKKFPWKNFKVYEKIKIPVI